MRPQVDLVGEIRHTAPADVMDEEREGHDQRHTPPGIVADVGEQLGPAFSVHDSARDHRHAARRQATVLQHMLGYFKQALDRESRAELLALIQDYGGGRVPLVVPLTLFAHHIRRCGVPYLAGQIYLRPHPVELMLRNHV